jgi:hypothetical protein
MSNLYCTLTELHTRLGVDEPTDDLILLDTIDKASRYIEQQTGRYFYPRIATYYFDWQSTTALTFYGYDLLSLTTLTTKNGATTISSGYFLVKSGDYNRQPFDAILLDLSGTTGLSYADTPQRSQTITGVWGYHEDYTNAFIASGDTVLNSPSISASVTSITVANGNNFEIGQMLRIGTEWLYLSGISTNTLTVERGINGSTAAIHLATTAISIYKPDQNLHRVAVQLAAWLYKQYDAPFTGQTQAGADGTVDIPGGLPVAVSSFINEYQVPAKRREKWQILP